MIDGNEMSTLGLSATDLTKLIACDSYYSDLSSISVNVLTTDISVQMSVETALIDAGLTAGNTFENERFALDYIATVSQALSAP